MFDVGFLELLVIFVLGLLILGPERLPRVAAQIGRWVGRARRAAMDLRRQLEREVDLHEPPRPRPRRSPPPGPTEPRATEEPAAGLAAAENEAAEASRAPEEAQSIAASPDGDAVDPGAAATDTPSAASVGAAKDPDAPPEASHEPAERRVSAQNGR